MTRSSPMQWSPLWTSSSTGIKKRDRVCLELSLEELVFQNFGDAPSQPTACPNQLINLVSSHA